MKKPINTKSNALVSLVAAGVTALCFTAATSSAFAEEVSSAPTKVVSYADLNLDTPAGASTFYRRIQTAARDVCSLYDGRDLSRTMLRERCFQEAVSTSVSQVNKAQVTAVHVQTVGRAS